MSKKIFTDEEVVLLSKNTYVKNISNKGITYTDEFKQIFIVENQNGKLEEIMSVMLVIYMKNQVLRYIIKE